MVDAQEGLDPKEFELVSVCFQMLFFCVAQGCVYNRVMVASLAL